MDKQEILSIIKQLNIKEGQIKYDEYITNCPLHEDIHPSFAINLNTGLFNCLSGCGGGTLKQLIERLNGDIELRENDSLFNVDIRKESLIDEDLPEVKLPFENGIYPSWILDRGFTETLAKKYELCYNSGTGSLVIPIRDYKARLVGWVCRRPQGIEPKYIYSIGLQKEKILFGEHLLRKEQNFVCVCEGPLDAMWLDQHGYNAIALLGMQLSEGQQKRLLNTKKGELVICLDNDAAGKKGIYGYWDKQKVYHPGFISKMKKYAVLSIISLPPNKKDIQEVRDSQQVISIIEHRQLVY